MTALSVAEKLIRGACLTKEEFLCLLSSDEADAELFRAAREKTDRVFGKKIYLRGLIEISSFCKNDCFYCGLRCSNQKAQRYRLTKEDILEAAKAGYGEGLRTFVLQGGEDPYFTPGRVAEIVESLKTEFPAAAVTLSLGEQSEETYALWRRAGADRYLLRHETATEAHYKKLHPASMLLKNRLSCLHALKTLGYQVGAGFMVGSPFQTLEHIAEDLLFLQSFRPHMIGIGPFLPQKETPFSAFPAGSFSLTIRLLAILRLGHERALLPATTALATLAPNGREKGILAGANVVMPNLSPPKVLGKYAIYDNKAQESLSEVRAKIEKIGYETPEERGDYQ